MSIVRIINKTKIVFLVLFAVAVVGIWTYQFMYAWPEKRCEGAKRWWAPEMRYCGVPVQISDITGRPTRTPAPDMDKVAAEKAAAEATKTAKATPRAPAKP